MTRSLYRYLGILYRFAVWVADSRREKNSRRYVVCLYCQHSTREPGWKLYQPSRRCLVIPTSFLLSYPLLSLSLSLSLTHSVSLSLLLSLFHSFSQFLCLCLSLSLYLTLFLSLSVSLCPSLSPSLLFLCFYLCLSRCLSRV